MPEIPLDKESQEILAILKNKPEGLKISQILNGLVEPITRRTLQRRLSELKSQGLILSQGDTKNTLYFIQEVGQVLPLSKAGKALKAHFQKPLQQRTPVGYNTHFLYDYRPNDTYYLPEKTRIHLKKTGQQFNHELEPGTYVKRILHQLLIDLSWNSSRLEGNTYSLLETERLIEYGAAAAGKNAFETQMILNHKEAIEFMAEQLELNKFILLNIHALLSNNLLANPKARGQLRRIPVGIGRTVYSPPEVPQLIEECFQHILDIAKKIIDPFEQAFFLMVQLPYLQPFEDVNKRVSRLAANLPLIKNNLSPLSFIDVPQADYVNGLLAIYELNKIELMRDVFVWAYERSAQQYQLIRETLGEPNLIYMQFKNELFELVNLIINSNIRGAEIVQTIEKWTQANIAEPSQAQFIRLAEKEIAGLHEGNIAVYRIKPEVFVKWRSEGR